MITLGDRFAIRRSPYCWELLDKKQYESEETGETKEAVRITSYDKLESLCKVVIARTAGEYDGDLNGLQTFLFFELSKLTAAIKAVADAEPHL